VKEVGTIFVDHFGPLPVKRGGIQAVFVTFDWLSGYVTYQPVRAITADATISAMEKTLARFDTVGNAAHTVVSDNAPCFKSAKWTRLLIDRRIRMKKITPYNANANAVERHMRELGTGLRLRLNANGTQAVSHRSWDHELRFLEETFNETPKSHGYSPKAILGLSELTRDPSQALEVHVPDPRVKIEQRMKQLVFKVNNIQLPSVPSPSPLSF